MCGLLVTTSAQLSILLSRPATSTLSTSLNAQNHARRWKVTQVPGCLVPVAWHHMYQEAGKCSQVPVPGVLPPCTRCAVPGTRYQMQSDTHLAQGGAYQAPLNDRTAEFLLPFYSPPPWLSVDIRLATAWSPAARTGLYNCFPANLMTWHDMTLHYTTYIHIHTNKHIPTCVRAYVRTYVRTYIYTHIHKSIHTYIYIYIYIHTYMRTCVHSCMYVHTYIRTYVHTYQYIRSSVYTYIRTYVHTYIRTYVHTYIHAYMHACMHTYKHT